MDALDGYVGALPRSVTIRTTVRCYHPPPRPFFLPDSLCAHRIASIHPGSDKRCSRKSVKNSSGIHRRLLAWDRCTT